MRKIGTVGLFVTFALVLHLLGALALASGTINVYVGQTTTFSVNYRVAKLAIGDPQVADYIVEKNKKSGAEILINGKRPGSTNLIVWNQAGQQIDQLTINVLVKDLDNYMKQIQGMIGDVDGLNFRTAGGKLIIEGEVSLPRDVQRIKKVVGDSPQVMNLVTISPVSLNLIAKTIDEGINTPGIKVSTVGQKIILEGVVYSKEEKERIEKKARLYYWGVENLIETKKSDLDPGYGETIQVTAHFMEVSKNAIRGWGIKWAPGSVATVSGSQDLAGGGFAGAITGLITNLFPKYRKANERSEARILETSSLSVRSGDAADFLSGGEMGIQSINSAGVGQTTFKEYGIKVNVTPIAQGQNVSLKIKVEVSAPTTESGGGVINFRKSRISTVQFCKSGDSIALGGLISQRDTKVFDKIPSSGGDALIQLQKSTDFNNERSRFVIFVTPMILADASQANLELKGMVEEEFGQYDEKKR